MTQTNTHAEIDFEREILTTRLLPYPVEDVFRAWGDPEKLKKWWGPSGFTNTFEEFDFRVGGHWRFIMHGPNGANYPNESSFLEIVDNKRIVLEHKSLPHFQITASFEKLEQQTMMTFRMSFPTAEECAKIKPLAVDANEENLDKLEMVLSENDRVVCFVVSRIFDAARHRIFSAFSDKTMMEQWWGPAGFDMISAQMELRKNGAFHYCMRSPSGFDMWGKFIYQEIEPDSKLIFTNSFSNANGDIVRAPFSETWPLAVRNSLSFAEHERGCILVWRGAPEEDSSKMECETFKAAQESLHSGFTKTLDQLTDYLELETD